MSILIKGIDMPTNTYLALNIYPDGRVAMNLDTNCATAISVPPHGRLGDLDALAKLFKEKAIKCGGIGGIMVGMAAGCIDAAPTIIEAEEVDND